MIRVRSRYEQDHCHVEIVGDVAVLRIRGGFTESARRPPGSFLECTQHLVADNYRKFIWEFSEVDVLDSAGFGQLLLKKRS